MTKHIADGEYDLDFSGLFSTVQSDVFGIRYGFKPDTIDEAFPSFLYKDVGGNARQTSPTRSRDTGMGDLAQSNTEIPVYLVSESKESTKAITTNLNKDDHIYFEGRSRPNTKHHQIMAASMAHSASPTMGSMTATTPTSSSSSVAALDNGASHFSSMSEFLLSYDDVSKSFKVDVFNGFIKMNKSRDPEIVSSKINKLAHRQSPKQQNAKTATISRSYIDSLLASLGSESGTTGKPLSSSSKRTTSPVRPTNVIQSDIGITKPYGKSISGISPVRRNVSNSPVPSPTRSAFQPSKVLSPVQVAAPLSSLTKPPSPLRVSSSPSPVLKTAKNGSTLTNGGTGIRKTQKSLLLRKAERAVGINKSRVYKPKLKEPTAKEKEPLPSAISGPQKSFESTGLRIRQRELKEARPEQAEFELVLTPPPLIHAPVLSPASIAKKTSTVSKKEKKTVKSTASKVELRSPARNIEQKLTVKKGTSSQRFSLSDEDLDNFAEELESEMDTATGKADKKTKLSSELPLTEQNTTAIVTPTMKETGNILPPANDAFDDDFNIEFSDWEDADAVDGPVLSDENELTAGNSEFQLIIEDDPLKSKEMKERKKLQKAGTPNESPRPEEPVQMMQMQVQTRALTESIKPTQSKNTAKPTTAAAKDATSAKLKSGTKSSRTSVASTPKKTGKTKNAAGKTKKKTGTPQKSRNSGPHEDDEIDRELDAELDKAFDDLLDEEDMSEEE